MKAQRVYKWHFMLKEDETNEIIRRVLNGEKRYICCSMAEYDKGDDKISQIEDLCLLSYPNNIPACLVRIVNVKIVHLNEVDEDVLKSVGDNTDLLKWKTDHERMFKEEAKNIGFEYSDDMLITFEQFEIVQVFNK